MSERLRRKTVLWIGGAYALIVGLMTLPDPLRLTQQLIGDNVDTWIFYWNNWWLGQAIHEGRDWLLTTHLFYPQETNLIAHSISFLNSLLALLFEPVLGPVVAYNLVFLLGLWIGALGMFLLLYEMTQRASAAFVAGFVFAFAPYHLTQSLSHTHLGSIHWWPFYALFLRRAMHEHRIRDALCAGLFAALTFWSGFQLALLLALWTALYVAWRLWKTNDSRVRFLAIAGLIGIVGLTLSAPLIIPVVKAWPQMEGKAADRTEGAIKQTDLLAYFLPPNHHTLVGSRVARFYTRFVANKVTSPYLGYTVIGLALLSLFGRREGTRFWLLSALCWMALAAGSVLRVNGALYPQIPLPYRAVEHLFLISTIRAPDRFNLLVTLSLSISAGLGAAYVAALTAQRWRWALIPVGLLVAVEFLCLPLPAWKLPPASPFFAQMAEEQTTYGVVDYPMGYTLAKRWLYYQTLHGKPSVDGHLSRYTAQEYAFIASQPLLRVFYRTGEQPSYLPPGMLESATPFVSALGPSLRSLESSGVRYILLHKPFMNRALWTHFYRAFPAVPVYDDETLAVYDVAQPLPLYYDSFPIRLAPDVALARFDVVSATIPGEGHTKWRFQILARLLAGQPASLACQIRLTGENGDVLTLPLTLFEAMPENGATWAVGDLEIKEEIVQLPQNLESGEYRWSLSCPRATTYTAPETLKVRDDDQVVYLRRWMNVNYGDVIELEGYRWRTPGAELQVTLRWHVLERPRKDYKVFVHLLNGDGEIVRQYDAMPCNWQCPTKQWQDGETILDQSLIPLGGLPPGKYRLAVGLYDAKTGERLSARGPDGERHLDDYVFLPDVFEISH